MLNHTIRLKPIRFVKRVFRPRFIAERSEVHGAPRRKPRFKVEWFIKRAAVVGITTLLLVVPGFSAKPCASMTIKVEPATLSPGTQAFATGSIKNCSTAEEAMLLKYQATGPCDFSFAGTVKADVAAGETKTTTMPFIVPPNACPGTYKLTVSAYLDKVRLATTSASVTVQ